MAQFDLSTPPSPASQPTETLQGLCTNLSGIPQFFCNHLGDEMRVITGAPVFMLLLTALIIYGVSRHFRSRHEDLVKNLNEQVNNHKSQIGNLESRIQLRDDNIAQLEKTTQQMKQINEQLIESKQVETHNAILSERRFDVQQKTEAQEFIMPEPKPIFTIEEMIRELRYKEEGKDGSYPVLPNVPVPDNASLQLLIMATIKSSPPLIIQDVRLEITSPIYETLLSDWMFNQTISYGEVRVSFNVNSLPPDVYSIKLVINQNDETTSDLFTVRIDR